MKNVVDSNVLLFSEECISFLKKVFENIALVIQIPATPVMLWSERTSNLLTKDKFNTPCVVGLSVLDQCKRFNHNQWMRIMGTIENHTF